jgi:uracil-DNA glycosylase
MPGTELIKAARSCTLCAGHLPHAPMPVFQSRPTARILIAGQAPGRKVHETGFPFNDATGLPFRTPPAGHRAGQALATTLAAADPVAPPRPRNNLWLRRNPWFEEELLPALKQEIAVWI